MSAVAGILSKLTLDFLADGLVTNLEAAYCFLSAALGDIIYEDSYSECL